MPALGAFTGGVAPPVDGVVVPDAGGLVVPPVGNVVLPLVDGDCVPLDGAAFPSTTIILPVIEG